MRGLFARYVTFPADQLEKANSLSKSDPGGVCFLGEGQKALLGKTGGNPPGRATILDGFPERKRKKPSDILWECRKEQRVGQRGRMDGPLAIHPSALVLPPSKGRSPGNLGTLQILLAASRPLRASSGSVCSGGSPATALARAVARLTGRKLNFR